MFQKILVAIGSRGQRRGPLTYASQLAKGFTIPVEEGEKGTQTFSPFQSAESRTHCQGYTLGSSGFGMVGIGVTH